MKAIKTNINILWLFLAIAISSAITYVICNSIFNAEREEMRAKIAELEQTERQALVTRRISEQMEDIAFQQKAMSDKQRERAEEQSRIADMERGKAEIERATAREQERRAVRSARQADSMRVVAEAESERATHHMLQAQAAQAQADTLFYRSLGRSLAQTSIQQSNVGDEALASLLSYSAWYYTKEYGGNQYQQDIFSSLVRTSGADKALDGIAKGGIRKLAILRNEKKAKSIIAISDYGEILSIPASTFTQWGSGVPQKPDLLFANSQYDFRDIIMKDKEHGVVLSVNGEIANIDVTNNISCTIIRPTLPQDFWQKIFLLKDSTYLVVGNRTLARITADCKNVMKSMDTNHDVTSIGQRTDGTIVLCCNDGHLIYINKEMDQTEIDMPWMKGDKPTSYVYYARENYDIIGSESGALYVCTTEGELLSKLVGHTGAISAMESYSRMVMSASYDKSVRIWDMGNLNTMIVSNEVDFDLWPLCINYDYTSSALDIGFANGSVHSLNISAKSNAEHTRSRMTREFTPFEWNYYIGKDVEYKTFMP
ncbi:MAG: hypothetical protein KBT34_05965 [Prevotella sp.]|nr:hypothetical protein [Candidatus Prevotella equi]